MTGRDRLEKQLALLGRLRQTPVGESGLATLRQALADKSPAVIASAARIAGSRGLVELEDDLAEAYLRLLPGQAKADPGCNAKTALAEALAELGSRREDVFSEGVRLVQLEPVWGGQEDVAGALRAACALGLASTRPADLMAALADLLADPVADARLGAIAAIAASGDPAGMPLLRFKARVGDDHPQVLFDCLGALVRLDAGATQPFLEELLEDPDAARAEAAALALGESRLPGASASLRNWWDRTFDRDRRAAALTALALLRDDESLAFLFDLLSLGPPQTAEAALRALAVQRADATLWQEVAAIAGRRVDMTFPEHLL